MTARTKLILGGLAVLAVIWLIGTTANRLYFERYAELATDIEGASNRVGAYRVGLRDHRRVLEGLGRYVDRTLGGDLETVDHRLRTRLNRLGEKLELTEVVVGTGRAVSKPSPAKRAFSRRQQELRDEIDFVTLTAWISAEGTLEQALRLVHAIEREPWIKRIDQLELDPDENGARMGVTVRLTTLFVPGRTPSALPPPDYDGAGFERYATLIGVNPFQVPVREPESAPSPEAGPESVLALWTITGIAETANGAELWLLNEQTRETRTWRPDQSIEGVTLIAAGDGEAIIERDGSRYAVAVGEKLNDTSRPVR